MAAAQQTLANLIVISNANLSGGVMDELLEAAPLVAQMAALPASNGHLHQHLIYGPVEATASPGAGFRAENDGRVHGSSRDTNVTLTCSILDASIHTDTAVASAYRFGTEAYLEREAMRALRSAFARLERQIINGTAGSGFSSAAGFAGLIDNANLNALADPMVDDAGGVAANAVTSVFALRSTDPEISSAIVTGNDGEIMVAPSVRQMLAGTTGHYGVWFTEITSWYCYQHGGLYGAARLANVDPVSAVPVVTDDAIAELLAKFPSDRQANFLLMNRASRKQLQQSRTATNATGAPAPFPTEAFGVPIIVSDQVANTEAVVA